MACWSNNAQPSFCPVNGADKLVNVTVTSHTCGPRQVYDIRHIYGVQGVVVYGCHVTFNLCYIRKFWNTVYILNLNYRKTNDHQFNIG